jgi:hypothetical protein
MTAKSFPPAVFQSFEEKSDPRNVAPRLSALRAELEESGLDAFLIPRADAHRGESVPPGEARLAYVTGFTGSAGLAIIGRIVLSFGQLSQGFTDQVLQWELIRFGVRDAFEHLFHLRRLIAKVDQGGQGVLLQPA